MAKNYLKADPTDPDTFIVYDTTTRHAVTVSKAGLTQQLAASQARLAELPVIDDAYLLKWAKENFGQMDVVRERAMLTVGIAETTATLAELAKVK